MQSRTPTERLILMSLRHDPYQTVAELASSTGAGETQLKAALRLLRAELDVHITPDGYHYAFDPEQPDHFAAVLHYLGSGKGPYGELGAAAHEIRRALISHRRDRWGRAFPLGMTQVELQWATRHTMEQLTAAIAELQADATIISTPTEFGTRYILAPEVEA